MQDDDKILDLLLKGQKIQAIQLIRESQGLGLADAKELAESLLQETQPKSAESSVSNHRSVNEALGVTRVKSPTSSHPAEGPVPDAECRDQQDKIGTSSKPSAGAAAASAKPAPKTGLSVANKLTVAFAFTPILIGSGVLLYLGSDPVAVLRARAPRELIEFGGDLVSTINIIGWAIGGLALLTMVGCMFSKMWARVLAFPLLVLSFFTWPLIPSSLCGLVAIFNPGRTSAVFSKKCGLAMLVVFAAVGGSYYLFYSVIPKERERWVSSLAHKVEGSSHSLQAVLDDGKERGLSPRQLATLKTELEAKSSEIAKDRRRDREDRARARSVHVSSKEGSRRSGYSSGSRSSGSSGDGKDYDQSKGYVRDVYDATKMGHEIMNTDAQTTADRLMHDKEYQRKLKGTVDRLEKSSEKMDQRMKRVTSFFKKKKKDD